VCTLYICAHTHKEGREFFLVESGDTELRTKFLIYMHISMHIYTCTHPRTPTRVYVCVCIDVRVFVRVHIYKRAGITTGQVVGDTHSASQISDV